MSFPLLSKSYALGCGGYWVEIDVNISRFLRQNNQTVQGHIRGKVVNSLTGGGKFIES
jgi:hypothetical protein